MLKSIQESASALPSIDPEATGRNFIRLRKQAGLSVRAIQEAFGFSTPQAIYKWQRGLALPTLENMAILSRLLGVTMEQIIVYRDHDDSVR